MKVEESEELPESAPSRDSGRRMGSEKEARFKERLRQAQENMKAASSGVRTLM